MMRYLLSILLLGLICGSSLSKNELRKRMSLLSKALKNISNSKKEKRMLQNTDESQDSDEEPEATIPEDTPYTPNPDPNQGETNVNATAENSFVPPNTPVSIKPKVKDDKTATIQILKFHSFTPVKKENKITFGIFFYFFNRHIPRYVIFRLRITYSSKLRNLQEEQSESVRTDCVIKDESLLDRILTDDLGANVDYNCSANSNNTDAITNVTLNTDVNMTAISKNGTSENVDFNNISFNGNSSEEADNLVTSEEPIKENGALQRSEALTDKYILKLSGQDDYGGSFHAGDKIEMNLLNKKGSEYEVEPYNCTLTTLTELECDTKGHPIYTTVQNLHASTGTKVGGEALFTLYMKNGTLNESVVSTRGNNRYYNINSSGLSGGAIAGIVIACVVVLAAASIAAILLRKPSPPIENTTMIDLKHENI